MTATKDAQLELGIPLYRTKREIADAVEAIMAKRREVAELKEGVDEAQEAVERTKAWARLSKRKGDHKAAVRQLRQLEKLLPEGVYRADHPGEDVPGAEPEDDGAEFPPGEDPRED